ncbi:MAG TPA: bifunctional ornithine acetyltransferase/N-acetylglutamate synthase, partial [Thermodesulfovibrionales bacterium]|nr:bifunctional ornithine acetyltransferase/N-acetylglutamate synthase [Thermodesulfovibrionales bacterium]
IMANGLAGNDEIGIHSMEFRAFESALGDLTRDLSRMIIKDGEGATKLVEVEVRNARNQRDADNAAFAIANSMLVKTALYGNDANWGRIMAALGRAGITIKEEKTDIYFGRVAVVKSGIATGKDKGANAVLTKKEIRITVDLNLENASSNVLTCDLTEGYVRINAEYRT